MLTTSIHSTAALAEPCPAGAPSCKIVILTPDEEKVLTDPRGIFDTAAQARQLDLANFVVYFRQKLQSAPAGEVKKAEETPPIGGVGATGATTVPNPAPIPTPDPRK